MTQLPGAKKPTTWMCNLSSFSIAVCCEIDRCNHSMRSFTTGQNIPRNRRAEHAWLGCTSEKTRLTTLTGILPSFSRLFPGKTLIFRISDRSCSTFNIRLRTRLICFRFRASRCQTCRLGLRLRYLDTFFIHVNSLCSSTFCTHLT